MKLDEAKEILTNEGYIVESKNLADIVDEIYSAANNYGYECMESDAEDDTFVIYKRNSEEPIYETEEYEELTAELDKISPRIRYILDDSDSASLWVWIKNI